MVFILKRWVFCISFLLGLTLTQGFELSHSHASSSESWEDVAVKETKKRYPLSQVLFSQKIWDKSKKNITVKQYRLTLREGLQDFAVYTTITYDSNSGKIKTVQVIPEA